MGGDPPVAETIYGPMALLHDPDDLICRSLRDTGEWSYLEAAMFAAGLGPEDLAVDAGAFLGTFGLGVRRLCGARVLAVEPDATTFALLRRNLAANGGGGCAAAACALGAVPGRSAQVAGREGHNRGAQRFVAADGVAADAIAADGEASDAAGGPGGALGGVPGGPLGGALGEALAEAQGGEAGAGVARETLAGLRRLHGDYTALKLDIEGAELDALKGDARFIRETRPLVWAECNETRAVEGLLGFFLWAGLDPHYVAFPAFRRRTFRGGATPPFPLAYEAAICGGGRGLVAEIGGSFGGEEVLVRRVGSFRELKLAMWDTPRWGRAEWAGMSRVELAARLGRTERGERFGAFLARDCGGGPGGGAV